MDLSTWDTDDMKGEEYVGEKKYRRDIQNLTPNDILVDRLLNSLPKCLMDLYGDNLLHIFTETNLDNSLLDIGFILVPARR